MIKQLNPKESISNAISQAVDLFKKCLLVDKEKLLLVVQRTQHSGSLINQYLNNLGQFLGGLTVAVEAYVSDRLRPVVIFVSKILKECQKSSIFKPQNPWIKANLEILREIYELHMQANAQKDETALEIESLFRTMGIQNVTDIKHQGFLKASITRQFISQSQQVEYSHLINKSSLIPPPPALFQNQQQLL